MKWNRRRGKWIVILLLIIIYIFFCVFPLFLAFMVYSHLIRHLLHAYFLFIFFFYWKCIFLMQYILNMVFPPSTPPRSSPFLSLIRKWTGQGNNNKIKKYKTTTNIRIEQNKQKQKSPRKCLRSSYRYTHS